MKCVMAAVKGGRPKAKRSTARKGTAVKKRAANPPARRTKKAVAARGAKKPNAARPAKKKESKSGATGKEYGRRADYGASVDEFVTKLSPKQRDIVNALREIVREAVPGVAEGIRWGMPVFTRKKLICYASPKGDYVRFGFYARIELDDPEGRLAGSLAYVKLEDENDIERPLLTSWIKQIVEHTEA